MLNRHEISYSDWERIKDTLPPENTGKGRPSKSNRDMLNGMHWRAIRQKTIDRMILSLTLDCQSQNSGIVRFFQTVIQEVTVSSGYISGIIAETT